MSRQIELEIHTLLSQNTPPEVIADELLKRWKMSPLQRDEEKAIASFLLQANLHPSLMEHITQQIERGQPVLWSHYVELVGRMPLPDSSTLIDKIIEGALQQNASGELCRSQALDHLDPRFASLRAQEDQKRQHNWLQHQKDLLQKIEFFKSQRLFSEERKALDELYHLGPNDPTAESLRQDFEQRWARHIVSSKHSESRPDHAIQKIHETWQSQTTTALQPIFETALSFARKYPPLALDLAIMMRFMDYPDQALTLLLHAPETPAVDWLHLELCLETRRFVDALEATETLERKYITDPETHFAVTLAQAKAYKGLNQNTRAIDLLTSLINVRPNYRSASSLLQQWTGGSL